MKVIMVMFMNLMQSLFKRGFISLFMEVICLLMLMLNLTSGKRGVFLTENVPIVPRVSGLKCDRVASSMNDMEIVTVDIL